MRVCVVVPSISDFYFSINRMTALGARVVCRLIREAGHEAIFLDFPSSVRRAKPAPRPDELSYLDPYLIDETGPVSFFTGYKRLGPDTEVCARRILETTPDLVLVSCFAYAYAEDTLALTRALRELDRNLSIVVGGAGASVLPDKFIGSDSVTFVLAGEAETNLIPFLREHWTHNPDYSSIPGLYFREGSRPVTSAPRRDAEENELAWIHSVSNSTAGRRRLTTSLSRGCPRSCSFCSNHLTHGRRFRKTPIESVIAGIDAAAFAETDGSRKNVNQLNFEDDNLLADRDYAFEVIRYARKKLNRPAIIEENGIDSGFLDTELLDTLIGLGLNRLNLSLGSLDSRVLAKAGRNPGESRIAELTSHASGRGVESVTYFICGLPGDTTQTVAENLLFLASLETKIGISLYYPVPGIQGFEDKAVFIDFPARLCCGSSAYPWTKTLSTTLLVTAFRLARFLNLIKESDKKQHHDELVRRTLREGRLHTWRKAGSGHEIVPVPHMAEDLVTEVITSVQC